MLEIGSSEFPFTTHTAADEFTAFAIVCGSPVQPSLKNKNVMMPPESYQLHEFEKTGVDK